MAETLLLVDDEPHIVDLIELYARKAGYECLRAHDGATAVAMALESAPALMVLDLMLPKLDGWEVCRRVRAKSDVPIIMLTARDDDVDKIVGLELGADDYLTKPFNPRELMARIKAILRRAQPATPGSDSAVVTCGNLTVDPARREARIETRIIKLRAREFDLLLALAVNPGIVFTRERLLEVVWGFDFAGETRTVDVHVAQLRKQLAGCTSELETVFGVGYRLTKPVKHV